MTTRTMRHLVVLFIMSILCVTNAAAQGQSVAPKAAKDSTKPIIHRATVDSTTNQITVEGVKTASKDGVVFEALPKEI